MGRLGNGVNPELIMMPLSLLTAWTFVLFTVCIQANGVSNTYFAEQLDLHKPSNGLHAEVCRGSVHFRNSDHLFHVRRSAVQVFRGYAQAQEDHSSGRHLSVMLRRRDVCLARATGHPQFRRKCQAEG